MLDVDCDIVAGEWDEQFDWDGLAARAITAAIEGAGYHALLKGDELSAEVSVRLSDDEEVQRLNRDYRGKDKPTNILSFPMHSPADIDRWMKAGEGDILLGDLALAEETVAREAAEKQLPVADHVAHLLVHGTLHLLGHDHQDDETADAMEALEIKILAGLGIADPYADALSADGKPIAVDER